MSQLAEAEPVQSVLPAALQGARQQAEAQGLAYAGDVSPDAAWALAQNGEAVLVDVRSAEEYKFVGHVPGSVHVAWASGTSLTRNPRFVRELEQKLAPAGGKHAVLLLICRSGKRSVSAAEAAHQAGFTSVFNVLEGFEGEKDAEQHRGQQDGWRFRNLPWVQD
jgi:rhodanese-related sulfurtransferase